MEEIVPILEPLAEMTEILGKEDQPTGGAVYILLYNICPNVLARVLDDSNITRDLKLKIKEGLQKQFKIDSEGVPDDEVLSSPLVMASVLDPRYKTLLSREILPTCKLEVVHLILRDLMATLEENVKTEPDAGQGENIPHKKAKILDILQGDVVNMSMAEEELNDYLKEPVKIADPLSWWKTYEGKFPKLSNLAKNYLAVPVTSVPSERIFLAAGITVAKLKASLAELQLARLFF